MNPNLKKNLIKYSITTLIGGSMTAAVLSLHGFSAAQTAAERYRILCDAFTIPGVVLMMCAVLVLIANEGTFYGLSYSVRWMFKALIPFGRNMEKHETYYEYVERKREAGKIRGFGFIFITGAVFFAVSLVFLVLFYQVY